MNRAERRELAARARHEARAESDVQAAFRRKIAAKVRANARLRLAGMTEDAILETYDRGVANDRKAAGIDAPGRIPCKAGCAACCEQVVLVHELEARSILAHHPEVIADVLRSLPKREEVMHDLSDRIGVPMEVLDFLGDQKHPGRKELRTKLLDAWYALKLPCLLLDPKTKRCRVYASRPVACRDHVIIDEHPKVCDDRSGKKMIVYTSRAATRANVEQIQAADHLELPPRMGVLSTMLMQIILEEKIV